MILDNLELDNDNLEFKYAIDLVQQTNRLVYVTGKAGTGKTTFLKYLKQITTKNTAIVAYTGVAAINAGGQTINSFFKIPFGPFVPNDKRLRIGSHAGDTDKSTIYNYFQYNKERLDIIQALEVLVIDEVSMVRCDMLDVIDQLLKVFRKRLFEPFGGVQVILIGDTFQLPPVDNEWHILENYYKSPFFFSSKVIENNKPVYIELKKIYRQKEQEFIDVLDRIRINQITQNEIDFLNSKFNPLFTPNENQNYIILATHNNIADNTNLTKLANLPGDELIFEASIIGEFAEKLMPTDRVLRLKENAQIIFIKNDKSKGIYNGRIAKIKKIDSQNIIAEYEDKGEYFEIVVEKQTWSNIRYSWNEIEKKIEEEIIGTFTQFPVKLAWAITVHKSQGLTFEKVIADVGSAFASGQVYVALSRCTSSNGLVLKSKIERQAIKTDARVVEFAKNETPSTFILQELNSGKADLFYKKSRQAMSDFEFEEAFINVIKAFKYRNDLETILFKRYFVQKAKKLSNYKSHFEKITESYSKILSVNNELKLKSEQYEITIDEQTKNANEQLILIESQKDALEIIRNKLYESDLLTKELAKQNILQKNQLSEHLNEIQHLNNKKIELQKIKIEKKNEIEMLNQKLSNVQDEIQLLNNEISRLGTIKWHQKLFGKK